MRAQSAHVAHVLLAVDGVDDRARAQEQERLEEGVREEVGRSPRHRHRRRSATNM